MSVILGLNAFHADSAACLVVDGRLIAAVAEERLGERLKHSPRFPENAIRSVLRMGGVRMADVTHVAVPRKPASNVAAKAGYVLRHPVRSAGAVVEHLRRNRRSGAMVERLAEITGEPAEGIEHQVVPVEHHLAHIASSYYVSPFDGLTAGFSYDASGDFVSAMAARCEGTRIEVLDRVPLPDSLGFFYTAFCQLIGFDGFGEEYKVMGLSAMGEDRHAGLMRDMVRLPKRGWYRLDRSSFGMHEGGESGETDTADRIVMGRLFSDTLRARLGPTRGRDDPITQREMDIARSVQTRFEEAAVHCMQRLHGLVPTPRLVMAGGCALNGVANARILRETPFEAPYLQAAASDDGTCLGAALWAYHNVVGGTERFVMRHAYWGPAHAESRCRAAAEGSGVPFERLDDGPLCEAVADLLAAGKVVGWYQGRSEWGPRALGNRSILANPAAPDMKDVINRKIKRRELFRPFAPTVLRAHADEVFEQAVDSPFMMHVVKIRPAWRARIPAVTHVDGTGRLQTLERDANPLYHDLIEAFRRKTGVPLLLNTSFNENEPIVDTPAQALDCFQRTDMDALCLGPFLLVKGQTTDTA